MATAGTANAPLAAIDTNVLMEMGADCASTHNAIMRARILGIRLIVTPTVIEELAHGVEIWDGQPKARWAQNALESLVSWGIQPGGLVPVGHGICERFYDTLVSHGYLPEEERHDALVLAEASLWNAKYLITWDQHLLGIPPQPLSAIMNDKHLAPVIVISPKSFNDLQPNKQKK